MVLDLGDKRERALEIVKLKGPLLPVQIAKEIDTDIMFAGAILSELIANGKIKITTVKVGGSPLYYVDEQKDKLQELVKNLNEKDQKTAELLKEKKILKDSECEPLERVSLRQIKDFAKSIQVKERNEIELFWKWYLIKDEEAEELIKKFFKKEEKVIEKPEEKVEEIIKKPEEKKPIQEIKKEIKPNLGLKDVHEYFTENNIKILNADVIKKNKEINYIVEVNSEIGAINFFVKYRDKKKLNEGDLSLALNESKNMPLIFLTTGELSKKTEKLMETEYKGILFRKL